MLLRSPRYFVLLLPNELVGPLELVLVGQDMVGCGGKSRVRVVQTAVVLLRSFAPQLELLPLAQILRRLV